MFIAVMVIYLIILAGELMPLYKNKQKKELVIFVTLSIAALTLNLLQVLQIKIPSPSLVIEQIVLGIIGK
jgi:hypothetical protein